MKRRFTILTAALALLAMIVLPGRVWANDVTFSYSDYTGQGTSSSGSEYTMVKTDLSIKNTKFYGNSSYAHFYAGAVSTITPASGVTITKLELTATGTSYNGYQSSGTVTASTGTMSHDGATVTWTGSATSAFTISNNKQIRWTSIVATYTTSGGGDTPITYTVTYNSNGGTGTMTDSNSPYNAGTTVTVLNNTFTRDNYTFSKWNTAADGSGTEYNEGATFTINANTTLYAQWTENGGGTGGDTETPYTFNTKSWGTTTTNWISGKDGSQFQSGRGVQVTSSASGANATSPKTFTNVSSIVVTYSTNASKGTGAIKVKVGDNAEKSFSVTPVGTTDHTTTFSFAPYETGSVKLTVDCSENSIYIKSITITETSGSSSLDSSDLAITNSSTDLTFDLYPSATAQVISYTTSSTGAITITPASPTTYFSYAHDAEHKTITVTPLAVTPSAQTVTISQAANDDYYAGTVTFTVSVANSAPLANIAALTAITTAGSYKVSLTDALVTYIHSNNAYLEDANGAVLLYHCADDLDGLAVGDKINGTANVTYTVYNGLPEVTAITLDAGYTMTHGNTVTPAVVTIAAMETNYTSYISRYVKIEGATVTSAFNNRNCTITQNENSIVLRDQNSSATLTATVNDVVTVTAHPAIFNSTHQIAVYEQSQIVVAKVNPSITFSNGSLRVGQTLDLSTLFTSNSQGAVTYSITSGDSYATLSGSTLTGEAEGTVTVKAEQAETISFNAGEASATITVQPALVLSSIAVTTAPTKTTYDEGESFDPTGMVVTATYTDNTTDVITGYTYSPVGALATTDTEITISYTENNVTKTTTQAITVNEVVDYVTLPFNWAGGTSGDLTAVTGVSGNSLSDYAAGNAPYRVKFDNTGDYILIKTNEQPAVVSVGIKKVGGDGSSSIIIQSSSNGSDFNNVETFSNPGDQNDIMTHVTTNAFNASDRYVRIYFNKPSGGSNVGVGPIIIKGIETYTLSNITGYSGEKDHYYLIASPVTVDPATVFGMTTGNFDLYYFDESQEDEWRNYEASSFDLVPGKGYLYAMEAIDANQSYSFELTGIPYAGTGTVNLDYTDGAEFAGWNLIGNPFGTNATLDLPFYRLNQDGSALKTETEDDEINVMEGVFVQASATIIEANFTQATGAKRISQLNIKVTRNRSAVLDNAIIRFDDGATLGKFQLNQNDTKVYFTEGNQDYAIVRSNNAGEMPVSFKAAKNGNYTISVEAKNVEASYLHLIDNMTGADVDLLATPSYTFVARTTDYESRFRLVFDANSISEDADDDNASFAYFNGSEWVIANNGEATLQVIDVMGRVVKSESINGNTEVSINQVPGVYMLRLVNGNDVKVQKVVVR